MYNKALEILNIFDSYGYQAYIVGGYPRDKILNIKTNDIDICTDAKPKDIMKIFDTENINEDEYGSVRVLYKNCLFDITTFRRDIKYENNRKPIKIKYITDLKRDLLRRDFTINTLCIDKDGKMIDVLSIIDDINNQVIRTVGNPRYRIKEDSLRILRAIRFASVLDFDIDEKTIFYIKKYGYLLKKLSYYRKKEELNKIFSSRNKEKGRKKILDFGIDKYLEIDNLSEIVMCDDIIGIWSQLKISSNYPFTKIEMDMIKKIREMLCLEIDRYSIYKYGLYISTVVGSIKGVSYREINDIYNKLVIKSKKDININGNDILNILKIDPSDYISKIMKDIEKKIIDMEINNDRAELIKYIKDNY